MYRTLGCIGHVFSHMSVYIQVADSRGHTLFQKDDASKGKFAFTTEDYDMFEVCFHSTVTGKCAVGITTACCYLHALMRGFFFPA